ncbi:Scarecrow-like protein 32 [Platanthera guangdongensis]|uniref:Scarecrow-like protein 32 n=1 Tax=Platanthera guangdongensis TaxID=2320717 RepID=A0ABR2LK72_9ASPA
MQFTESAAHGPPPPLHPTLRAWPDFPYNSSSNKSGGGQLSSLTNAACMEQLLAHCAHAIDTHDATLAQQLLWVLHNIAPPDGDSNQRLTAAFLRALVLRASRSSSSPCAALAAALSDVNHDSPLTPLSLSPVSLAAFIDLTPWHRFGFSAANAAITDAADNFPVLHLVDLSTTYSMQLPTLIESLAARPEGAPFLRVTVASPPESTSPPPTLDMPLEQLGARLVNFARSRNVSMEFRVVPSTPADGFESLLEHLRLHQLVTDPASEALVINCHMMLHCTPDESAPPPETAQQTAAPIMLSSLRTMFLKALRALEPTVVVVVDEDADFTAGDVVGRLRAAFNYMWIPFDAVENLLPRGGEQRRRYEASVCWKIENSIAQEGVQRVERLETRGRWTQRMRGVGFRAVGFGEDAAGEVKSMLDEHSAGWGLKKDEEELILTWKGHDAVFASAWMPSSLR